MSAFTAAHWGIYEVHSPGGPDLRLSPFAADPHPSPIGLQMVDAYARGPRVLRPAVRRSWIDGGWGARPDLRGKEPFVEVGWDEAADLAATVLRETIAAAGNGAIYGGSYGWSSAGRFHHAQSQVHRFLNALGGYVRHADTYSLGAGRVLMPHVVAPMDYLMGHHTTWNVLARHTQLFVSFGGVPEKNAQTNPGLVGEHTTQLGIEAMRKAGTRFINISPVSSDLDTGAAHEWLPIRPNTDTALLLAIAHTLYTEGLHDRGFLATHCVGFERFVPYLTGARDGIAKDADWASAITTVAAARIRQLARELAASRSMLTMAWALQRAQHGEQPFWALVTVACMLGQVGLPGGGFGLGYGAANGLGQVARRFGGPTLPQGTNPVQAFIPVARVVDMLEKPGEPFDYNGQSLRYPRIDLVYWAGGNPFHHHQDLNRMVKAWRKPKAVIVHEQFWTAAARMADVVLPATSTLERDDIGFATTERFMVAMKAAMAPVGQARDDFDIFADIARRMGREEAFTEGLSSGEWLRKLYAGCRDRASMVGVELAPFEAFWEQGVMQIGDADASHVLLEDFRRDPAGHPLKTPSGRIEIFSERIAGFGYDDCAGHATWYEPAEWLGGETAKRFPLHLVSDQPHTKLHSQLDHGAYSRGNKIGGREPVMLHPSDAAARGIADGDLVRLYNDRGSCLAGARISAALMPGVVKLSTGAWFDPAAWDQDGSLDKHGNANALTLDVGSSKLSQGCAAQTCLVEIERFTAAAAAVTAFDPPRFATSERQAGGPPDTAR